MDNKNIWFFENYIKDIKKMKQIIIILGYRRSGSTILAKALGCNSNCSAIGEINSFHKEIKNPESPCGCGKVYYSCKYWKRVIDEINIEKRTNVQKTDKDFNVQIGSEITKWNNILLFIPTLLFNKLYNYKYLQMKINNTFYLYKKLFEHSKSNVLIDSTKTLFRALVLASFQKKKGIEFKFIFLVRDGRAVLNSTQKGYYFINRNDGSRDVTNVEIKKPEDEVKNWRFANTLYYGILKVFRRKNHLIVKHEDFCNNPKETLERICIFSNIPYESKMLEIGKHENHILGGNPSRINATAIRQADDKWRNDLDKNSLEYFQRKAGWLNFLIGYNK